RGEDEGGGGGAGGGVAAGFGAGLAAGGGIGRRISHAGDPCLSCVAARFFRSAAVLSRHYVVVKSDRPYLDAMYTAVVPKLWTETIEEHRRAVRDAALDTTAALVAAQGLTSVALSQMAGETAIV